METHLLIQLRHLRRKKFFFYPGRMKFIEDFMAGLMCIGGGVLLATVFIHMLPEVRDSLQRESIFKKLRQPTMKQK